MNENIFLSIIIPCYNVADYLPKTIKSLKSQTKNISCEFIMVNDGSEDGTLELLRDFKEEDNRVVLIDKKNEGVSIARNEALKIAKGEYVYFVDGDDYLSENALECIYKELINKDIQLLIPGSINTFLDKDNIQHIFSPEVKEGVYDVDSLLNSLIEFPLSPQNIYALSLIRQYNIEFNPYLHTGEVFDFTVKYLCVIDKIKVIHKSFYYYVCRSSSATHKINFIKDATSLESFHSIVRNGKIFFKYTSFQMALFKLVMSFTFNKYLKNQIATSEVLNIIKDLSRDNEFRICAKHIAFDKHNHNKERVLSLLILYFPIASIKIASILPRRIKERNIKE